MCSDVTENIWARCKVRFWTPSRILQRVRTWHQSGFGSPRTLPPTMRASTYKHQKMKLLAYFLTLPSILGAEIICSDSKVCPEGNLNLLKMLHHFDGEFRCCDIKDFSYDSELARSRKTIKVHAAITTAVRTLTQLVAKTCTVIWATNAVATQDTTKQNGVAEEEKNVPCFLKEFASIKVPFLYLRFLFPLASQ
ncbi:hypothetical protein TNCV_888751 [Trichonephila clavipes]|nr:hypothetical protein TNCV_888751 [Trichonephila clavipes]